MRLWIVALFMVFAGCAKRVALPQPPPRDAPLEQRLEAFEKLAPIGEERVVMLQGGTKVDEYTGFLLLGGGWRVQHPADLLPVVDADSVTAKYARSYLEAEGKLRTLTWVIAGMGGVSILGFGTGMGLTLAGTSALLSGNLTLTAIGIGLVAVSGIVMLATIIPLVMAVVVSSSSSADRSAAFLAYTKSLRERLALTDADLRNPPERGPPRPEPSTLNSLERTWPRPASASLVVWAF